MNKGPAIDQTMAEINSIPSYNPETLAKLDDQMSDFVKLMINDVCHNFKERVVICCVSALCYVPFGSIISSCLYTPSLLMYCKNTV